MPHRQSAFPQTNPAGYQIITRELSGPVSELVPRHHQTNTSRSFDFRVSFGVWNRFTLIVLCNNTRSRMHTFHLLRICARRESGPDADDRQNHCSPSSPLSGVGGIGVITLFYPKTTKATPSASTTCDYEARGIWTDPGHHLTSPGPLTLDPQPHGLYQCFLTHRLIFHWNNVSKVSSPEHAHFDIGRSHFDIGRIHVDIGRSRLCPR